MKRLVAGAIVALLLGACSSSGGGAAQPDDEFLDDVEATCRDASEEIRKLSPGEGAPAELLDIFGDAADSLGDLEATDSLSKDWDRYIAKFDEVVSGLGDVVDAVESGDAGARLTALDELNSRSNSADLLVNTLGAIRCRGLMPFNALIDAESATEITIPTVPPTDETIPDTEPTDPPTTESSPPNTPLSIDTIPDTEAPPPTDSTPDTVLPTDLSVEALAPVGFEWVPYEPPDAAGLYSNSIIGDLVTGYAAGEFSSTTDPALSATAFVVTLSTDFTPEYTAAYEFWEAVDEGTKVVTPGGLTVQQQIGAFTGVDCAVYTNGTHGLAVCVATGVDGLTLLDQFVTVNGY